MTMVDEQKNLQAEEESVEEESTTTEEIEEIQMEERPQLTPVQRVINFVFAFVVMTLILQLFKWLQTL